MVDIHYPLEVRRHHCPLPHPKQKVQIPISNTWSGSTVSPFFYRSVTVLVCTISFSSTWMCGKYTVSQLGCLRLCSATAVAICNLEWFVSSFWAACYEHHLATAPHVALRGAHLRCWRIALSFREWVSQSTHRH